MNNRDGTPMTNSSGYQMKALAWIIPQDMVEDTDEASLRQFVEEVFIPAILMLPDVEASNAPIMDPNPTGYNVVRNWNDITDIVNIRSVIQMEVIRDTAFPNPNAWIQDSQENLYSMFTMGTITAEIARTFQLTAVHVAPDDQGIFQVQDDQE